MRVQRPSEPQILAAARDHLHAELKAAWQDHEQRTPPQLHPVLQEPDVLGSLLEMTGGSCAYCERPLELRGGDAATVTHHRPAWGAVGLDGQSDLRAYWWLTYSWDNLYPACADCIRTRGTRFPVAGSRATAADELAAEAPLLLDPIGDDPDEHLHYQRDGSVAPLSDRGRHSIELLALNRDSLIQARLRAIREGGDPNTGAFRTLHHQTRWAAGARSAQEPQPMAGPQLPPAPGPDYDLSGAADAAPEQYFQATQWIERLVIRNFRPIRDLQIDFSRSASERGPWTVLLGENGCGKSSVLHALALTLMGGDQRRALGIDASAYLRHGGRDGLVQVFLTGRPEPLELRWQEGDSQFGGPEPVPALLLGYGATRLLPRHPPQGVDERVVRVDNLFDPLIPLTDPTAWLLSLDDETFADVARGIHAMLALDVSSGLERMEARVVLRQGTSISDLAALSDGYQAMVVMACDILRTTMRLWGQPELAEGIVLIDEIGAHLHPRWRLRVVSAMRALLPRIQFIVTTHDPLCLRGIVDGEVVVMRRNSTGDIITLVDLPPVTGMSIEQLLTSEHFGLGSTDDPGVAELWEQYYRLKGTRRRTQSQEAQLELVRTRLDELEQLGATERERLLLASADKYIAAKRETGDVAAPSSTEVTDELRQLWDEHLPRSWR